MGIYDRDYHRGEAASASGTLGARSGTTWIVIASVLLFIVDALFVRWGAGSARTPAGPIERWSYFSIESAIYHAQAWRFVTFAFIHGGAGHLALNMLALFLFAPVVEAHFGRRRFLAYYLLCCMGAAAGYLILWLSGVVVTSAAEPLLGASAGVLGVMVAAAQVMPDTEVPIVYLPFPLRLRVIVWMALIGGIVILLRQGLNGSAQAAHLGGAVAGLLLMYDPRLLSWIALEKRAAPAGWRRRSRRTGKDWSRDFNR